MTSTMEINRSISLRLKEQKRSSIPLVTYPFSWLVLSELRLRRWLHFQEDVKETTPTKSFLDEFKKTTSSYSAKKRFSKETKSNFLAENSSKEINSCTTTKTRGVTAL